MKQEHNHISYIGGILFFTGLILIFISWYFTYPIYMPEFDEIIFTQFYPSIWPGMIFSLLGLFLTGYYSRRKIVKIICTSIFPIVLYIYVFYFSLIPTSDSASAKAMFEIFHYTGINPTYEPYFNYPIFFTLNEMTNQILGFNANSLAIIFFILFGFLIALYIYLFILKTIKNDIYQIAFFAAPLYFIATYSNINYQWVPQTLATVFFLMLLLFFNQEKTIYKILGIIIFTVLVFTHLFIPVIFLIYIGIFSIKKKELRNIFLLMSCIYTIVLIFHATFYLQDILKVFKESFYGFGNEYINHLSQSFKEPTGFLNQIISTINRFRIPLIWAVLAIGFLVWFLKRKINLPAVALFLTGGIYFGIGLNFSILGNRAIQIIFIPLVIGIGFFLSKWKKTTLIFITIIIILSIFGPIRESYDSYQYQLNEEENTCNFLANTIISTNQTSKVAIGGLKSHYINKKFDYVKINQGKNSDLWTIVPKDNEFNIFFDTILKENEYIVYNPNLVKEVISNWINEKNTTISEEKFLFNNKIFECGKTSVIKGRKIT